MPTPTILFVEDSLVITKLALLYFRPLGAEVRTVVSGEEAIEAVQESSYDLVLMDVEMPGIGGIEATRRIREWERQNTQGQGTPRPKTRIVAMTAHEDEATRASCLEAGMNAVMHKPLRTEKLQMLLRLIGHTVPESSFP